MSINKKLRLIIADEDRISSLPDHILHCILRRLEAKNAAQTCIISKRWRYVWTKLHILKFRYPNYQLLPPLENNVNIKTASFAESVRHFLSHRDSSTNIHAIQFVAPYCFDAKNLNDIICYAFRHNVKRLSMKSFYTQKPVAAIKQNLDRFKSIKSLGFKPIHLSHYLSGCQSLTMLKLDSFNFVLSLPKSLNLPALQVVHLEWFPLLKINQDTFSSCPSLRVLNLYYCVITKGLEFLNICSPKLKYLSILYLHKPSYHSPSDCKIVIDAPSLACFKFEGLTPLDFFMGELPSLNSFRIVLQPHFDGDIYKQRFALLLIKMLTQLCNAKKARLSLRTLEVLSLAPNLLVDPHPPFCNLKSLRLRADEQCKEMTPAIQDVLNYLLKRSADVQIKMAGFPNVNFSKICRVAKYLNLIFILLVLCIMALTS